MPERRPSARSVKILMRDSSWLDRHMLKNSPDWLERAKRNQRLLADIIVGEFAKLRPSWSCWTRTAECWELKRPGAQCDD